MGQYPSGMPQSNECHQMSGYDLSHHHHSFANSFPNHSLAHHSAAGAAAAAHGMTAFSSDYGKQSEEYSKAMMASEGHHFAKASATASSGTNPNATMIDCYAKLTGPEANNNWNHHQSYAGAPVNSTSYGSTPAAGNPLCHGPVGAVGDYSHQYGLNIGHNF